MIGETLNNRYKIEKLIGEGATAIVYQGIDLRLQRDVAVKVLLPHVNQTTRRRFEREAHAAARLNHPNIMAIYDIGQDKNYEYLVVELIQGRPLYELIPAQAKLVADIGHQICVALNYAHQVGLIHRDIKPANIYLTQDHQVKLMDFGLAIPKQGDAKRLTADGTIIGTPAYLSPEQAQGLPLDPRTDIYSTGIVLYEMVTGLLPFDADDIGTILLHQVRKAATPPRQHNPDIPEALDRVIMRALEKKPQDRFLTAREMGEALLNVSREEAALTEPPPTSQILASTPITKTSESAANRPIRIVLADDHALTRQSLAYFLDDIDGLSVVGQAENGEKVFGLIGEVQPDVVLLDLNMPGTNGLVILPKIRSSYAAVKVLILTGREEKSLIMRALRAGAHGYVLKTSSEDDLERAVRDVAQGRLVLGYGVAERLVDGLMDKDISEDVLDAMDKDILTLVAAGMDDDEIAHQLGMPEDEMMTLLMKAIDRLGVTSRTDAALMALRAGWIRLDDVQRF
ncbi:MAG: protein kinase [Anaerolineales bacterium]|nr:protein kinase [Anaerolineales bacterium]